MATAAAAPGEDESVASGGSSRSGAGAGMKNSEIAALVDQKNYVEELNRHLTSTVGDLEAKMVSLAATNTLMKEDLAISKGSLAKCQEENRRLLAQLEKSMTGVGGIAYQPPPAPSSASQVIFFCNTCGFNSYLKK